MKRFLSAVLAILFVMTTAQTLRAETIWVPDFWPDDGIWIYVYAWPDAFLDARMMIFCGYACAEYDYEEDYTNEAWFHDTINHNDYHNPPDYGGFILDRTFDNHGDWVGNWEDDFFDTSKAAWDCSDSRSDYNQEYVDYGVYSGTGYMPLCGSGGSGFQSGPGWGSFNFSVLNTGDWSVAVVRNDYLYDFIPSVQSAYGSGIHVTSAYRNPAHNAGVGGASNSRHLFGDGVDLKPNGAPSGCMTSTSWNNLVSAGYTAGARACYELGLVLHGEIWHKEGCLAFNRAHGRPGTPVM